MPAFLEFLIPILAAAVTVPLFNFIKTKVLPQITALGDIATRLIVAATSYGVLVLVSKGVVLVGGDISTITQGDVGALVTFGLSQVFHLLEGNKPNTPAS